MTTELPPGLTLYRSKLRDAIERDLTPSRRARGSNSVVRRHWRLALPAGLGAAVLSVLASIGVFDGSAVLSAQAVELRTSAALAKLAPGEIAYAHVTVTNAAGATQSIVDVWNYGQQGRLETVAGDGSVATDTSWTWTDNGETFEARVVNYANSSWYETTDISATPLPSAAQSGPLRDVRLARAISILLKVRSSVAPFGVSHATLHKTTLNGQPALELGLHFWDEGSLTATTTMQIWIDPSTYLPIQLLASTADGTTTAASIQWLAPTSSDLSALVAPIPAGFTQVSSPPSTPTATTGATGSATTGGTGSAPTGGTGSTSTQG